MSIDNFLINKQHEVLESENFKKWNADNKLSEDGFPIIAFHGSTHGDFEEIDFNKLEKESFVGKGFYSTDYLKDAELNYANSNKTKEDGLERYEAGDLRSRIGLMEERLSDGWDEESIDNIFDCTELPELIKNEEVPVDIFEDILDGKYFPLAKKHQNEDGYIEWKDFVKDFTRSYFVQNQGWVHPVFVKMTKPAFYTYDENATFLEITDEGLEQLKYDYGMYFDSFETSIYEFVDYLTDINDGIEIKEFDKEELITEISQWFGFYCANDSKEVFEKIIEIVEENEFEFEEEIDIEEIKNKLVEIFIDNDLAEGDINDDVEDLEFIQELYFFDNNTNEEEVELYKEIKEKCKEVSHYDSSVDEQFREFESNCVHEDSHRVKIYDLFKFFYNHDNVENRDCFNEAISEIFDGIVLEAADANNEFWKMNNIQGNTLHYIVFNENNIKSAIGNNGKYSLYDNKMCARRVKEQKNKKEKEDLEEIIKNLNNYKEKYNGLLTFSLEKDSNFFYKNDKALFEIGSNILHLNINNINNAKDLSETITHEVFGHIGLELLLGKNKNKFLEKVANHYTEEDYKEVTDLYPELKYKNKLDRLKLTEEKICIYAEKNYKHDTYMNKVVNKLKHKAIKFKEKLGLKNKIEDQIFSVIHEANMAIENKLSFKKKIKKRKRQI